LNLIMERGFTRDIEIYRLRFVVVFEPSDLPFVEFKQPGVQLLIKIVYLARLPVEADNGIGAVLARPDDVVKDLLNRGNVGPKLWRVSNAIYTNRANKNLKYQIDVTLVLRRGRRCQCF
jgi:hypothetical protein